MSPGPVQVWFHRLYQELGFSGASSHSGRRTFITRIAKKIVEAGGSLRDVQELAGHASLSTTQRYIQGDSAAKRRVVDMSGHGATSAAMLFHGGGLTLLSKIGPTRNGSRHPIQPTERASKEALHVRAMGARFSCPFCGCSCGLRLPERHDVSSGSNGGQPMVQ